MTIGRRLLAALVAAVILGGTLPAGPVRAALAAPVLVSPLGGVAADVLVAFEWNRVPGAARYRLRVHHERNPFAPFIDVSTVNRRYIWTVPLVGDKAVWSVRAVDAAGNEGPAASATFTSARHQWTGLSPADGAVVVHPDQSVRPRWDPILDTPASVQFDRDTGVPAPIGNGPALAPGAWSWRVKGAAPAHAEGTEASSSAWRSFTVTWPGGKPVPTAPANGASVPAESSVRLHWDLVPGAGLYRWEFGKIGEHPHLTSGSDFRANWADITVPLEPGVYGWRVRGVMSGTAYPDPIYGPWSDLRTVIVEDPLDSTPIWPENGATLTSWPVLRWTPVPGALGYWLQVSDAPNDDAPHRTPAPLVGAFAFDRPGAAVNPYEATPGTVTRYWRVRAQLAFDGHTEWTPWRSFTVASGAPTLATETTATLIGPADCANSACSAIGGYPILRWDPVTGASGYRVYFKWNGGTGPPDAWVDVGSPGLPVRQYVQADPSHHVAWSVSACPPAGCSEAMPTNRRHFRIALPGPVQGGPPDGAQQPGPSVGMQWSSIPGPSATDVLHGHFLYEVEYKLTPGEHGPDPEIRRDFFGTGTYFTRDAIRNGTTLAWRVRGTDGMIVGAWSPWRSMKRTEPSVSLLTPVDEATVGPTPTISWQPLPFPVISYRVEVARASELQINGPNWWSVADYTGATSITLPPLAPGRYRVRVQRSGAMYHQGDEADGWATRWFTVEGDPSISLQSPAAGATVQANDALLSWAPYPTAPYYAVLIGPSSSLTWDTATYRGTAMGQSHAVSELLPTGGMYWRVCALYECSAPRPITVAPAPGTPSDAHAPVSKVSSLKPRVNERLSTSGGLPVTIAWTASDVGSGITSQEAQLRRGSGSWQTLTVSPTARSTVATLLPASTYTFRTRAWDAAGNVGAWASWSTTTTLRQESSSAWRWSSGWTRVSSSYASGSAMRYAKRRGSRARMTVTARSIALVAPRSTTRGSANVYVDGTRVATIRLDASPTGARRVVYARSWSQAGSHTIEIRVVGTAGHPRVDIDAIMILR